MENDTHYNAATLQESYQVAKAPEPSQCPCLAFLRLSMQPSLLPSRLSMQALRLG